MTFKRFFCIMLWKLTCLSVMVMYLKSQRRVFSYSGEIIPSFVFWVTKIEPRITILLVFIWGIKMISDQERLTEWYMWATASSPGDWMHTFLDEVFIESNSTTPTGSKKKLPWAKYGHSKNDRMICFCLLTLYPSIQSLFSDTLSSISYIKSFY